MKPSEPEAEVYQELVEECLDKLGFLIWNTAVIPRRGLSRLPGEGDTLQAVGLMLENCLDLTAEMPVMLTIPGAASTRVR